MSLPEAVLQKVLFDGIRAFRKNPRFLDDIFRQLGQTHLQQVKEFFLSRPIDISINYPKTDLKAPSIVLLLKNESEDNMFLGDVMGAVDTPDDELSYEEISGVITQHTGVLKPQITETFSGVRFGDDFVEISEDTADVIAPGFNRNISAIDLSVVSGTGAGQTIPIRRMSPTRIDMDGEFSTILDTTSLMVLRDASLQVATDSQPAQVYSRDAANLIRKGSQYKAQYQVNVFGSSQNEVLYLYAIVKAIFLLFRAYMEGQGVHNLTVSGTDLAPRSEYTPDVIYQRSLNLQFTYPFTILTEMENLARQIDICLTGDDPSTFDLGSVPISASITLEP